jgi:hypothetical protein
MIKQKNIPWLGGFIEALFNALPFLSIINFLSIIVVLYENTKVWLVHYMPWLNLWSFVAIMTIVVLLMIYLVYKYVLSSLWAFRGKQMFQNENDIIERLDRIEKMLNADSGNTVHDKLQSD